MDLKTWIEQKAELHVKAIAPKPPPDLPPGCNPGPDAIYSTSFNPSLARESYKRGAYEMFECLYSDYYVDGFDE